MTSKLILPVLLSFAVSAAVPLFAQVGLDAPAPAAVTATPPPDVGGQDAVWRDVSKTPDQRARDILPRLTLEEKISLLHADGTFTSAGLPRFGIPKLWMSDGPQGVREQIQATGWNPAGSTDDFSTAMPADVALAASFDPELGKAFGNVIGQEAKTRGKNIMLCPGLNIMRTPLNGRNSEYLGEDPYLASRMAVGFVEGVQQNGVAACAKHFALNNQETNRNSVNVHVDERTMREIYLPAFKAAVTEGHAWAVMSAYNRVNGQFCSENDFLLNQVLKKDWGFQGLVMTDWGGCHSTVDAALHGPDLEMGSNVQGNHNNDFFAGALLQAVENNQVPAARIDEMALRNLRVMAATGNLNPPAVPDSIQPMPIPLMSPEHIAAARSISEGGIVLLKNAGDVLPLDSAKVKTIAIIGDNAKALFAHDGNSAQIKTKYEITPFEGLSKRAGDGIKVTYAQGYVRATGRGGRGRGFGGGGFGGAGGPGGAGGAAPATAPGNSLIDDAVAAAKAADVAIVVAGLYRGQDQEGADRPNMELPQGQAELIQAVVAANPKTVVVLNGGSPSNVTPWIDKTAGLLMYWYGGTEGGSALAAVMFGDVDPSGHLPCTWPKQLSDSPAHAAQDASDYPGANPNAGGGAGGGRGGFGGGGFGGGAGRGALTPETGPQETYAEGILVGYRWFDAKNIEPQFPFGFGLSYTTFEVSDLKAISSGWINQPPNSFKATCDVANTGGREGAEVVQLYISQNNPTVQRAPKELKAFAKVDLKPGEKKTVTLDIPPAAFTHYDVDKHAWIAEAGYYTLSVGESSRNLPLKTVYHLLQPISIPEGK